MNVPFESVLTEARMPPAVGDVLRLFQTDLSEVSFPALGRSALEAAIESLGEQLRTVERSRALLHAEEAELAARKEALLRLCERGLGYARVFASENEALLAAVDGIPGLRRRTEASTRARQPRASPLVASEGSGDVPAGAQLALGHDVPQPAPDKPPRRGRPTRDPA
jgi:hypothetical protein